MTPRSQTKTNLINALTKTAIQEARNPHLTPQTLADAFQSTRLTFFANNPSRCSHSRLYYEAANHVLTKANIPQKLRQQILQTSALTSP